MTQATELSSANGAVIVPPTDANIAYPATFATPGPTVARDVPLDDGIPELGSPPKPPIRFKVTGEIFECPSDLPVISLLEFAELAETVNSQATATGALEMLRQMFSIVLTDESCERFVARLRDKTNPIGLESMQRVIPYALEKYGMRPTMPSDSSSTQSDSQESGPSLTESAPTGGSISAGSPLPGS